MGEGSLLIERETLSGIGDLLKAQQALQQELQLRWSSIAGLVAEVVAGTPEQKVEPSKKLQGNSPLNELKDSDQQPLPDKWQNNLPPNSVKKDLCQELPEIKGEERQSPPRPETPTPAPKTDKQDLPAPETLEE